MSALTAFELREMSTMLRAFFEKEYMEKIYPVGAIYLSVNDTSPSSLFGGTWERIQDTFLLSAGSIYSAGSTGGSADAVLLKHNHRLLSKEGNRLYIHQGTNGTGHLLKNTGVEYVTDGADSTWQLTISEEGTTSNATDKNMPPYLAVYMWKRIA